jgi:hypothetical protein
MRNVTVTITNRTNGIGTVSAYPDGPRSELYEVPLYDVVVAGTDDQGVSQSYTFQALRFGVQKNKKKGIPNPRIVGLADAQSYVLSWSYITTMKEMAWRVFGGWFIHRGPAKPNGSSIGSIGCIEISGVSGWQDFNNRICELAGTTNAGQSEISNLRLLSATYQSAARPPLVRR